MKICMFCKNEIKHNKVVNDICSASCAIDITLTGKVNNETHWFQKQPIKWDGKVYYESNKGTREFIFETLTGIKLGQYDKLKLEESICNQSKCKRPDHLKLITLQTRNNAITDIPTEPIALNKVDIIEKIPYMQTSIAPIQYEYPELENYMRNFTSIMSKLPDKILKDRMHLKFQDFLLHKLCNTIILKDLPDNEINTFIACLNNIKPKRD